MCIWTKNEATPSFRQIFWSIWSSLPNNPRGGGKKGSFFFPKVINLHLATIGQFLKNILKKFLEKFSKKKILFFQMGDVTMCAVWHKIHIHETKCPYPRNVQIPFLCPKCPYYCHIKRSKYTKIKRNTLYIFFIGLMAFIWPFLGKGQPP